MAYLVLGLSYIIYAVLKFEAGFYLSAILFGLAAWSIPTIMAATAGDLVGQCERRSRPDAIHQNQSLRNAGVSRHLTAAGKWSLPFNDRG